MSTRTPRSKTHPTLLPTWIVEFRHRARGRTRVWMPLPEYAVTAIVMQRTNVRGLPVLKDNAYTPGPRVQFAEGLRLMFGARHADMGRPEAVLFRMRNVLTDEVIGEYRVLGECTCENDVCTISRRIRSAERLDRAEAGHCHDDHASESVR